MKQVSNKTIKWRSPLREDLSYIIWLGDSVYRGTTITFKIRAHLSLSYQEVGSFQVYVLDGLSWIHIANATDLRSSKEAAERFKKEKIIASILQIREVESAIYWDKRRRIEKSETGTIPIYLTATFENIKFLVINIQTREDVTRYLKFMGKYATRSPGSGYALVARDSRLVKNYSSGELEYEMEEFTTIEKRGVGRESKEKRHMCELSSGYSLSYAKELIRQVVTHLIRARKTNKNVKQSVCSRNFMSRLNKSIKGLPYLREKDRFEELDEEVRQILDQ